MPLTIDVNIRFLGDPRLDRLEASIATLIKGVQRMSNDLSVLQTVVGNLEAKATETNATLAGLAQAVIDLKNSQPSDVQAGIDALVVRAQAVLDGLTAAEDAADDQLPAA